MKKTYINPTLDVVEMEYTHQLLNGSGVLTGGVPGEAYTPSDESYSRESLDVFDDENVDYDNF